MPFSRSTMGRSAGIWNTLPRYPPTSEAAITNTIITAGEGRTESENIPTPGDMIPKLSMVYGNGSSPFDITTLGPRTLNYSHIIQQNNTSGQHSSHSTHLTPNYGLGSAYPINPNTGLGHFGHPSDPAYPSLTLRSDRYRNANSFSNTDSGYSTPSTHTHSDDPVSFPHLNGIGPNSIPQNLHAAGFLSHAVTTPTSTSLALAIPTLTTPAFSVPPTLKALRHTPYARNNLRLLPKSDGRPSQARRKHFACNISECRDKRFSNLHARLAHARRMHKQSFPCSCPDCPQMEDYTDFGSRQSLNGHWWSEHQTANHFRCDTCCYSTENVTHMKGHLKMHYQEEAILQVMDGIRGERNDRNAPSEAR